ncbi:MFS transporter, partial [Arthrobacter deserti]|nr:MFS transporter [Arthrobacter deserti]
MTEQEPAPPEAAAAPGADGGSPASQAQRSRTFPGVLANTAPANITTSYLWFALTFWVYLQTRNVIATGV